MNIDFEIMREPNFYEYTLKNREKDIDSVTDNGGWEDVKCCPICKSNDVAFTIFEEGIPHNVCSVCDCLYASKIPKEKFHSEYDKESIEEILQSPDEDKRKYRQERFMQERINYIQLALNKPIKNASLLDVGCNTGVFLEHAKSFFSNVYGVEQNQAMCSYVERKFKISTYTQLLACPNHIKQDIDVITFFDVIEHLKDPIPTINSYKKMLSYDGIMLFYTPNWRSLCFDVLGINNTQYFPPEHFFFLSEKTIDFIAAQIDSEVVFYETKGMDWYDIMAYDRDINKVNIKNSITYKYMSAFQEETDNIKYGNHMRFILKEI